MKISKNLQILLISIFLVLANYNLSTANKNDLPVKSSGKLLFYLDTASFRARGNQTYQEFYYQIPLSEVNFHQAGDGVQGNLEVFIEINDQADKKLIHDQWTLPVQAQNWQAIEGRFLPDQFELTMQPGQYTMIMKIQDKLSNDYGEATLKFSAKSFLTDTLILSETQFASSIFRDSSDSKFTKNSLHVLPNSNRVFGKTLPMLYFYQEIYNLSSNQTKGTYGVTYEVLDIDQNMVRRYPPKTKKKKSKINLEVGAINISTLDNSAYLLKVTIEDHDTGEKIEAERGFWHKSVTPEPIVREPENNVTQHIRQMNTTALSTHFRQMKYFLPPDQIKLYDRLDDNGKRNFLIQVWAQLDPKTSTGDNEFWDTFNQRVKYANEHYSASFSEGWQTDPGRIIIKYGMPNEITREAFRTSSVPYEEWFYNLEGGFRFVFADEQGFGQYRLIYSSKDTEPSNPNWRSILGR